MVYVIYKGCAGYAAIEVLGKCKGLFSRSIKFVVVRFGTGRIAQVKIEELGQRAILDTHQRSNGWGKITSKMKKETMKLLDLLPIVDIKGNRIKERRSA